MTLVKMFKQGDKVRTAIATNETELMNQYAFASGRDLTGEFYVERYCPTGNGAVKLSREPITSPFFMGGGMPLWVNQAELTLAEDTPTTTAPTPVDTTRIYTTTQVAQELPVGTVIECVKNVSFLINIGQQYQVIEKNGMKGFELPCGKFYFRGHSQFKVIGVAGPTGATGPKGCADPALAEEPVIELVETPPAPMAMVVEATVINTANEDKLELSDMAREDALAIVEAFLDGKTVQYWDRWDQEWVDSVNPAFNKGSIYRVKPELTAAEKRVIELKKQIAELEAEM